MKLGEYRDQQFQTQQFFYQQNVVLEHVQENLNDLLIDCHKAQTDFWLISVDHTYSFLKFYNEKMETWN